MSEPNTPKNKNGKSPLILTDAETTAPPLPSASPSSPSPSPSPKAGGGEQDWIKDSNTANFTTDVLQASMEQPVIVDFWATWCEPCKQLLPILEAAVREQRGAVRLVRIDIDASRDLAMQLQIQSVPTVYAFYQGQPVDGFQGALPQSQVRQFVDRLVAASGAEPAEENAVEILMREARAAREENQHASAAELFLSAYQEDTTGARAIEAAGEHLRSLLDGDLKSGAGQGGEIARKFIASLPEAVRDDPALEGVRAALELLAEGGGDEKATAELRESLRQDENDHASRYALAAELYAAGDSRAAGEALLEIMRRDRNWNDEQARKQLVRYFAAWGEGDPLTKELRAELAAILFA